MGFSPRVSLSALARGSLLLVSAAACAARVPAGRPQPLSAQSSCGVTAAPVSLELGRPITSSTARGESRRQASCVREEAPECVYSLHVTKRSDLRASLLSADFDGALALLAGADAVDELSCVDDAPIGDTHHARLDVSLEPGSYLLVVDGASGDAGRFELFAELEPLPALASSCTAAPLLEEGVYVRGSTRGGASLFAASCGAKAGGSDEVYRFDLDRPSRVRIREHSDFDAVLALRSECAEPTSELGCSDDGVDGHLMLSAELAPGRYFVVTDAYARGEGGDYVLALERAEPHPPLSAAQACAQARTIELDGARQELDTLYADSALSGSCGGEGAPEAVFRFKVPRRSLVTAELSQLELNAALFVRKSCEDAASELGCSVIPRADRDFAPAPAPRKLAVELDAGEYVLVVDGQRGPDMGAATLQLSAGPAAP